MIEPTETEPERIERETFEKACKAMCSRCDENILGMPHEVVDESRHGMPHKPSTGVSEWWHGGAYWQYHSDPERSTPPTQSRMESR